MEWFSDLHQNCKSMRNHIVSCFASRYPSSVHIVDDLVHCSWKEKKKNYLSKFLKFYLLLTLTNVVKLDSVEALCCGPGCMNNIANDQYLEAHIQSSHQLGTCEICWTKRHLWKNEMPLWVFSSHFFFFFFFCWGTHIFNWKIMHF